MGASFLAIGGAIATTGDCAIAQITPDGTLGTESSVVTPGSGGVNVISGGATRGANLFHSFEQFSVPTGGPTYFDNALDVQNIIARVTGSSISNIDSLLRANASANLFLLNPNGIIFRPNASLNIGGSILGSTALSLNFADGTQFSVTAHPKTPLLSVSVPIGLQFGGNAGSILNQSQATNSSGEAVGLHVQPGKTLALVGGNVSLDGGSLNAPGGRVELGGTSAVGTVELRVDDSNLRLSFPDGLAQAEVSLDNGAKVSVRAGGGGSIAINAQNLNLAEGSGLLAGIDLGLGSVDSKAGDIEVNATGAINLSDESFIRNTVQPGAVGNGGGINITTGSLSVNNGAQISTSASASTFGLGDAGSVTINASGSVLTPVPEPSSTAGVLMFGVMGTGWMLRRKLKK